MHPPVAAKAAWLQPLNHQNKPRGEAATRHGSTIRVLWVHGADDAPPLGEPVDFPVQVQRAPWPAGPERLAACLEAGCDVIVAELTRGEDAQRLLEQLRRREPAPPLVLVACELDPDREIALLRAGCAEVLDARRRPLLGQVVRRVHTAARQREELVRAGNDLRRSAQRFDAVFAHAPTAVLITHGDDQL
ncbi:MAG: hypothetical protein KGJ64_09765, partial [Betaproteobacteria bacterium]|nr:hypothetical protein [Betaproteobacteria bacterium]